MPENTLIAAIVIMEIFYLIILIIYVYKTIIVPHRREAKRKERQRKMLDDYDKIERALSGPEVEKLAAKFGYSDHMN